MINNSIETGANNDILCAICGRMTPKQTEISKNKSNLNAVLYRNLMRSLINDAKHPVYINITPLEECLQLVLLPLMDSTNNTDKPINPKIENNFEGGTYTFTSGLDPTAETSLYADSTQFALAMMNCTQAQAQSQAEAHTSNRLTSVGNSNKEEERGGGNVGNGDGDDGNRGIDDWVASEKMKRCIQLLDDGPTARARNYLVQECTRKYYIDYDDA